MPGSALKSLALAAALATIGFGASSAATSASGGEPQWIARPTASVIEHYYPIRAKLDTRNGKASMRCSVTATGTLESCRVLSETPKP